MAVIIRNPAGLGCGWQGLVKAVAQTQTYRRCWMGNAVGAAPFPKTGVADGLLRNLFEKCCCGKLI